MNERPHVDYFDGLRIFAALCVIFMHTAAGPLRAGVNTDWHLLNVCTSLAFTAVPLFFMMSGYLLMTSRKTADISVLLRHRLPRLVVPLAGWTVWPCCGRRFWGTRSRPAPSGRGSSQRCTVRP